MKSIIRGFVRNPVFANLLMVLIVFAGLGGAGMMLRELLPSFAIESVIVRVPYPGAGPEEVEEGITLKIEDAIETVQGIKEYTTTSSEGMASAIIDIRQGEDVRAIKDRIADRIDGIQDFPDDAENPSVSELIIRRDTMAIAVSGNLPERQLKELAKEVREELIALPAVSDVELRGARDYEISIEISEEALRKYGLTFDDVSRAVRENSMNLPAGGLKSDREEITIRTLGRRYTGDEYSRIVLLTRPDGTSLRLDQVATIRDGFVESDVRSRFNGSPAVSLAVYNSESEDALDIAEAVYEYVERKNAELPDGVSLTIWLDSTQYITGRIDLLLRNGRAGLLLVFLLLWLFLDLRLAFWVSMGIPISLAGAMFLMYAIGASINMISLFAMLMVLGIIVDDAIIVGEAIYVHRKSGKSPIQAAIDGTSEVALPVIAAILTTIIAFLPLLFVQGIMGKFIRVIPIVVICALLVSLVEGLIVLPAHLNDLPDLAEEEKKTRRGPMAWLAKFQGFFNRGFETMVEKYYRPLLRVALSWRYLSLGFCFFVLFSTVGLVRGGFVEFYFFPDIDTSFLVGGVEFAEGTPASRTQDAVVQMEEALWRINDRIETTSGKPMIRAIESNIGHRIGMDNGASEASAPNIGELRVELLDSEERGVGFRDVLREWEKETGPIPGALSASFQGASGGPPGMPIEIWLTGRDLDDLRAAADATKAKLGEFAGTFQIEDDFRPGEKELRASLKPEARNLGLTLGALAGQLRRGFYGEEVMRVQRGKDEVKVWVRYPEDERRSLADVDAIRIRTPTGAEVPLATVADLRMDEGYTAISRQNGRRRVRVTADVFTEVTTPNDVLAKMDGFLASIPLEFDGVEASVEGEKADNEESMGSLKIGFPLAVMGIFLIIATIFRSYLQPIVIMITIPFGIVGAIWGHLAMGYALTIMSMFGMVALTGVVVNDAIVTIEAINERLARGLSLVDSIVDGGARRFRAIFLTTATTVGGITPLLLEKSLQAQFLIPMGLTIAAGVMFATVLTLVMIPCLLFILNDARRGWWYLRRREWPTPEQVEPATRRNVDDEDFFADDPIPAPAG